MTREQQDILEDYYQGDKKDIQVTVYQQNGNLKDLNNCELAYAIFSDNGKVQTQVLLLSSVDARIEILGLGLCVVHVFPGDTVNLYGTYRHQLYVIDADGYGEIVMSGKLNIFKSFARRPRFTSKHVYLEGSIL